MNTPKSGGLLHSLYWTCVECALAVFCIVSFIISWFSYRNRKKKQKSNSKVVKAVPPTYKADKDKVSIIIAIKNEARYIGRTLRNLESTTIDKSKVEIVLVDCGSKDNTLDVAKASAGVIPIVYAKCRAQCSRGTSLNLGAEAATGEILLFLRADSIVPPGYDETIRRELFTPTVALTAFRFSYDTNSSTSVANRALYIISLYHNMLASMCRLPRGSQGLALPAARFRDTKYNADILLEDVSFVDAIRSDCFNGSGEIKILEQSILSSADDILAIGVLKHTFLHTLAFMLRYHMKASEDFVYRW
eukprot:CAMPEP_0185030996 /NCGR_PEP_ID=MMETSP1103-20130426/18188_1 /TAXON_ID=36769 /ORGANISM="Paraphysomonas bandaiensis, Strain Caron Lab Isolate" /LENGTH=303 /DNA_ID=CAMNT_0027566329 /DNA_START=15 /DNA_END=923 /DNA_ORIENTATION=+